MRIGAVATVAGTSVPKARMEMSDATVKLMDITSGMSNALQVGADDGQVMQRNGKRAGRMEDLIKREDAIKELADYMYDVALLKADGRLNTTKHYLKLAEATLKHIPSADRPQGEWKSVKASIYPYGYDVECSVCGFRMGSSFGYKYCPNCGAHMKGADNE